MAARSNGKAGNTPSTGIRKAAKAKPAPATPKSFTSPPAKSAAASTSLPHRGSESKSTSTNLFSDLPKPVKAFSGLFDLYEKPDGSFRAEFGPKTAAIFHQLSWNLNNPEADLSKGLLFLIAGIDGMEPPDIPAPIQLAPLGGSNKHQIHPAATKVASYAALFREALNNLDAAIGRDLRSLTNETIPSVERNKAKKRLQSQFNHTLGPSFRRKHPKP